MVVVHARDAREEAQVIVIVKELEDEVLVTLLQNFFCHHWWCTQAEAKFCYFWSDKSKRFVTVLFTLVNMKCEAMCIPGVDVINKLVHPDFHWPNSFATNFREFHWHATYIDSTWHGYTKGVSVVVAIATSN